MVKTGVFKKIAALTAALAVVGSFAISASAEVGVRTTTTYYGEGQTKVSVTAQVTGAGAGNEVTYYVYDGSNPLYVNQDTADNTGAVTFNYVTDAANLKSDVKIGQTGATEAKPSTVNGFTVTLDTASVKIPTEETTCSIAYELDDTKKITSVEADGATVSAFEHADGKLAVTFSAKLTSDVTLTVNTELKENIVSSGSVVDAAAIVSDGTADEVEGTAGDVAAAKGNRKISVLARVEGTDDCGIIFSATPIDTDATALPGTGVYAAKGKAQSGHFAVQLIDSSDNGAWIAADTEYHVAVYYRVNGGYKIIDAGTVEAVTVAE